MSRRRRGRGTPRRGLALTALAAGLLLAASGTAFTAGISGVPRVSVDHDSQPVTSFTASTPTYDDTSGSTIVSFTLTPAAGQARARVLSATTPDPSWEGCSSGDGTSWTCPVPGLTAAAAAAGSMAWVATP